MNRTALTFGALVLLAGTAHAQKDVFEVCKGESKKVVAGTGKMSIAVVYPDNFPAETTPAQRNAVAATLAKAERAKIVPAADVAAAKKLVEGRKWADGGAACDLAPSMVAVLGIKHPNLSTATASVECEGTSCTLHVDLERHGRPSAQRWVRYSAPLKGDKTKTATIQAAGPKLAAKGSPPKHSTAGMAMKELPPLGVVVVRSDVDGALEADRVMESSQAFAACAPKNRKANDIRGYWAEWQLSARGNPFRATVKPFVGRDPKDSEVADCLRKALEKTQLACPRDGKPIQVKTAICL